MFDNSADTDESQFIDPDDPWAITTDWVHRVAAEPSGAMLPERAAAIGQPDPWVAAFAFAPANVDSAAAEHFDWPPAPPATLPASVRLGTAAAGTAAAGTAAAAPTDTAQQQRPVPLPDSTPPERPATRLGLCILATLFCLPIGAVALVYALRANSACSAGDIDAAERHSARIAPWLIGAAVLGAVVWAVVALVLL